jgi:hypothetical protein
VPVARSSRDRIDLGFVTASSCAGDITPGAACLQGRERGVVQRESTATRLDGGGLAGMSRDVIMCVTRT